MLRECARSCAASLATHKGATSTLGAAVSMEQQEQQRWQEQQRQHAQSQPGEVQEQRDQHDRSAADGHQGLESSPATAAASAVSAAVAAAAAATAIGTAATTAAQTPSFSVEEVELRITEARANRFAELREAHEQDCRETLWRAWRLQREELERITHEAREREAILEGRLKAAVRRAEEAEAQVERFSSGEERRSLEGRIQQLAQALERTEVQATLSEDSLARCMQDLDTQESASASKVAMARQRVVRLQRSCSAKQRCRRLQNTSRQWRCSTGDPSSNSNSSCTARPEQLCSAPESLPRLQEHGDHHSDHMAPSMGTTRLLVATVGTVVLQLMALALWRLLAASGASSLSREPFVQQRHCGPAPGVAE